VFFLPAEWGQREGGNPYRFRVKRGMTKVVIWRATSGKFWVFSSPRVPVLVEFGLTVLVGQKLGEE